MASFVHKQPASSRLGGEPSAVNENDKEVLLKFAKHYGLEYFDTKQSAAQDETSLVRSATLDITQVDLAYLFGAYKDYDITCVWRLAKPSTDSFWITMAFSLHTAVYLPHVMIGEQDDLKLFLAGTGANGLRLHGFSAFETKGQAHRQVAIYAPNTFSSTVEHIISPKLVAALLEAAPHAVIEVAEDTVCVSVDSRKLKSGLLMALMEHGLQLARYIDKKMGAS